MRFYVRKRRQPPAIIIVALIDILIVLLIFLMVTTTFKQQQPALKLALPESSQAQRNGAAEVPPLEVSIDPQGNVRIGAAAQPVAPDALRRELKNQLTKNPELKLALSADKRAPWGQVVLVRDAATEAGIKPGNLKAYMKEPAKP